MNCNEWARVPAESLLPGALDDVATHAREAYPLECCGVLLGSGGLVSGTARCRNLHPEPTHHYRIDPNELTAIAEAARAHGLAIAGFYHSHPDGPAVLSHEDRRGAAPWAEFRNIMHAVAAVTGQGPADIAVFERESF